MAKKLVKKITVKEQYENARSHTEQALTAALYATRQEVGGIPLSSIAGIMAAIFDKSELRSLFDEIASITRNAE